MRPFLTRRLVSIFSSFILLIVWYGMCAARLRHSWVPEVIPLLLALVSHAWHRLCLHLRYFCPRPPHPLSQERGKSSAKKKRRFIFFVHCRLNASFYNFNLQMWRCTLWRPSLRRNRKSSSCRQRRGKDNLKKDSNERKRRDSSFGLVSSWFFFFFLFFLFFSFSFLT